MNLSLIIPCHNEEDAIPAFLKDLLLMRDQLLADGKISSCQILVVDDCSTDLTPQFLDKFEDVEKIRLFSRSGYGSALKTGFTMATGEFVAFMDLDETYDPTDLKTLIEAQISTNADIISGERITLGRGMSALRYLGNSFFSWLVRRFYKSTIVDACTGLRLFHRRHISDLINLSNDGLDFSLAITLWALDQGLEIKEVPVQYHFRSGVSKLSVFNDGIRFFHLILSGQMSRWREVRDE